MHSLPHVAHCLKPAYKRALHRAMDTSETVTIDQRTDARMSTKLWVVLCRYESAKIVKAKHSLGDIEYVAISHVWGEVEEQEVAGVEGRVQVSAEKAKFMEERLPLVIGEEYFWMDILCIDQKDEKARVAVTEIIPNVFRRAKRTLVIRDGSGFRDCCVNALGRIEDWDFKWLGWQSKLITHFGFKHMMNFGTGERFREGILERVWPLQEVMFSDVLQFVRCDNAPVRKICSGDFHPKTNIGMYLVDCLMSLAQSWAQLYRDIPATDHEDTQLVQFLRAFLTSGHVSRKRVPTQMPSVSRNVYDYWLYMHSTRRTSKPRDYILAVMPQYSWYAVPSDAKSMTFQQLFNNCIEQASLKSESGLPPLVSLGTQTSATELLSRLPPSDNIPIPACLGDFAKLLFGPIFAAPVSFGAMAFESVQVQRVIGVKSMCQVLQLIKSAVIHSRHRWVNAASGELFKYGDEPELAMTAQLLGGIETLVPHTFTNAIKILHLMFHRFRQKMPPAILQWRSVENWLLNHGTPCYLGPLVRTAALINCGLGTGGYYWSVSQISPIVVHFRNREILAFASNDDLKSCEEGKCQFRVVEAKKMSGWERFVLLAYHPGDTAFYTVGLFPSDIDLSHEEDEKSLCSTT